MPTIPSCSFTFCSWSSSFFSLSWSPIENPSGRKRDRERNYTIDRDSLFDRKKNTNKFWFMQLQRCTDRIIQLGPRNPALPDLRSGVIFQVEWRKCIQSCCSEKKWKFRLCCLAVVIHQIISGKKENLLYETSFDNSNTVHVER